MSGNNPPTRTEVDLYGPIGLRAMLRHSLRWSDSHLAFKYRVHEIVPQDMSEEEVEKYLKDLPEQHDELEQPAPLIRYDDSAHSFYVYVTPQKINSVAQRREI